MIQTPTLCGMAIPENFEAPTLWGVLSSLAQYSNEQEEVMKSLIIVEAGAKAKTAAESAIKTLLGGNANSFVPAAVFQQLLDTLDPSLKNQDKWIDEIENVRLTALEAEIRNLKNRSTQSQSATGVGTSSGVNFNFGNLGASNMAATAPPNAEIAKLTKELGMLRSNHSLLSLLIVLVVK